MQATSRLLRPAVMMSAVLLSVVATGPVATFAAPTPPPTKPPIITPSPSPSGSPVTLTFCEKLPASVKAANGKIKALTAALKTAQAKHLTTLQTGWANWDTTLKGLQAQWQQNRNNEYKLLMALATTPAEQTAVTTFETSVNAAVSTRETANAGLRTTYRNAVVSGPLATLDSSEDAAVVNLIAAFTSAANTAQTGCAKKSPNEGAIRTAFLAALKKAQATYATADKADQATFKAAVGKLGQTRTTDINANGATCKTAIKNATNALLKAFGQ